jgi:site-specific recombinase XerD
MQYSTPTEKLIEVLNLKNYSEQTIKSYAYHFEMFLEFKKGRHYTYLSSQDVKDYLLELSLTEKSSSFINQAVNSIRCFFTYILNRQLKDYLVIRPKKEKTRPILLSDNELQAIFNVCQNKKHKAIIALLYGAGLRVSEVVNLKVTHVDSECMLIYVIGGKGKKDRAVMLDQKLLYILEDYFEAYEPTEYLFKGQNDADYSVSSIQKFVKKYAILAGIKKKVHPHLFRHGFITGVLENGGDIHDAQLMAGHKSPTTTANVYAHLSPKYIASIKSPITNITITTQPKVLPVQSHQ